MFCSISRLVGWFLLRKKTKPKLVLLTYFLKKYLEKVEKHLWFGLFCESCGITNSNLLQVKPNKGALLEIKRRCCLQHSHKKRKDSLEGSLNRVLFVVELEFQKILVSRLPQHTSNVNNQCVDTSQWSKQLCSLAIFDQLLGALTHFNFIILILNCF